MRNCDIPKQKLYRGVSTALTLQLSLQSFPVWRTWKKSRKVPRFAEPSAHQEGLIPCRWPRRRSMTYPITYYMISMRLFFSGSTMLVANVPRMGIKETEQNQRPKTESQQPMSQENRLSRSNQLTTVFGFAKTIVVDFLIAYGIVTTFYDPRRIASRHQ